jgi:hypothetical protein
MKKFFSLVLLISVLIPVLSFAAQNGPVSPGRGTQTGTTFSGTVYGNVSTGGCTTQNIQGILVCVGQIFSRMIPLTASLALVYFLWGVSKLIRAQGDTKMIDEGKRTAFWGIIALFVLASIGGITIFLQHDLLGSVPNTMP